MSARPSTQVYNADGSITTTNYADDGSATIKLTTTLVQNPDGTKTETRRDASGNVIGIFSRSATGGVTKQVTADTTTGNVYSTKYTGDGGSSTTIYAPDGKTAIRSETQDASGNYVEQPLNPDGTPNGSPVTQTQQEHTDAVRAQTQADFDAAQKSGQNPLGTPYNNSLTDIWKNDLNGAGSGVKGFLNDTAVGRGVKALGNAFTFGGVNAVVGQDTPKSVADSTAAKNLATYQASLGGAGSHVVSNLSPQITGDATGGGGTGGTATAPKVTAAQASGPGAITAATVSSPDPLTAAQTTAAQVGAPPTISAGNVSAERVSPTSITAGSINAPMIGAPGTINAGSVSAPTIALGDMQKPSDITAQHIDRIMMDQSQTAESRDAMLKALAMAEGAANGTAPSAAVQLLQKAIDTNARQQLGVAGSLQGRSPGAALRSGQQGLMAANAASSADMAALRATEQATGRQQYGTFASSLYQNDVSKAAAQLGADVDIAKTNAGNMLEAAKSNQSTALQTSIANMNKSLQVLQTNAANALNAGEFNVAQSMTAQIENVKNTIAVATSNAANELQARITNLSAQMDAAKANQSTALQAGMANAANDLNAQIAKMQADLSAAQSNLKAVTDVNIANANLQQSTNQFNAGATNDINKFNTGIKVNTDQFNANSTNQTNTTNATFKQNLDIFNTGETNKASAITAANQLQQQVIDNAKAQGLRDDQIKLLLAQMGFAYQDSALQTQRQLGDQAAQAAYATALAKALQESSRNSTPSYQPIPTYTPTTVYPQVDYNDGTTETGANGAPILD